MAKGRGKNKTSYPHRIALFSVRTKNKMIFGKGGEGEYCLKGNGDMFTCLHVTGQCQSSHAQEV